MSIFDVYVSVNRFGDKCYKFNKIAIYGSNKVDSPLLILSLLLIIGFSTLGFAAKAPAPEKGGDGFKAVSLEEAKKLHEHGATVVACHSHTTDFMKGHPCGTIHITCLVPKDHKRTDMPLSEVDFDIAQLPEDKDTPIVTYCASDT